MLEMRYEDRSSSALRAGNQHFTFMLTQVYEVTSAAEAQAVSAIGIDHIGAKVGNGEFPRELSTIEACEVAAAVVPPSAFSALYLSPNPQCIADSACTLKPPIIHLGALPQLLLPRHVQLLRTKLPKCRIMRSIPVADENAVLIARSYEGIADILLLDSALAGDGKMGALGVTHDWNISRRIVEAVSMPVILAGGLGPDNVAEAIRVVRPAGVDSKTKTDRKGFHSKDLELVRLFHQAAKHAT